ncbi:MAG: dihydroorotate dehydrogenase [Candidatus Omnitrophica bacterium]|nr:dihydroorotate dehydrogenase [Candidatus Omnitrophota bacterium]
MPDLRVTIGSLQLANPVFVAAGTFGYGLEFARAMRLSLLGALITKTLTPQPREGNPPPRLVETPSGMLNAVGLQNMGLAAFLCDVLPALRAHPVPVIVSILGESPDDVAAMAQALDRADGVSAVELNLSCPNIQYRSELGEHETLNAELETAGQGPAMVAHDADATAAIVRAARRATHKPIIAKLSPDVTDLRPIALAAERAGADAVSLSNTFKGMSLDPATRRSRLGTLTGGLSGPAIRPLAVYRVWYTAQVLRIPIIGVGGIVRADDAVEFFLAGAGAVAIGTANFADPKAPLRVLRGLERYLKRARMASLRDVRGALQQDNEA